MKSWFDQRLGIYIAAWVAFVRQHARAVMATEVLVTLLLALLTASRLSLNMDHKQLLDPNLPLQKAAANFARYFPPLDDSLLVVVDGPTAQATRRATRELERRLRRNPHVRRAYAPGSAPFFEEHGLLYRSPDELDDFADHLAQLQPVLAELAREPTIANLARLVRMGLEEQQKRGEPPADWSAVFDRIAEASTRVFDEYPVSTSWESLMLSGSALDRTTRQVLIVDADLDFDRVLVARRAIQLIRGAARDLPGGTAIRVRITGNPALNYEEMIGLGWDVGFSSLATFVLVTLVLYLAFRSLRLAAAAALTLIVGLIWTAAFATVAIGQLNVLSITFGVLFIGLGIDFALHLGMHYAHAVRKGTPPSVALPAAAEATGSSLTIAAVTTLVGFYAFIPTAFRGVGELGLISGTGMVIILFQTLTCFPALIALFLGDDARARLGNFGPRRLALPTRLQQAPRLILVAAALLAAGAATFLPRLSFNMNVIALRDPRTESVQAFNDLLAQSDTSPWYINAVRPSLTEANALAERVRHLPDVDRALTLSDYVPADQEEKREILSDAAFLLDVPPTGEKTTSPLPVAEQVAALQKLLDELERPWLRQAGAPLAEAARRLRDELRTFLRRAHAEGDPARALAQFQHLLLGNFPAQLKRLRLALHPSAISIDTLPRALKERMLAADGHARVQIFPRERLADAATLKRFVDEVQRVAPHATGVAANLVAFGRATVTSLRQALLYALLAITCTIFVLFQRVRDTLLVLAPVLLAAVLSGGAMVLLGLSFNFANVVVLPLLLGAGVDSGIHLVHRARAKREHLLDSTTARAVFYSALTTIASFASLATSGHRGIAGLGMLLTCGMAILVVCNLIVLPALLACTGGTQKETS